MTDPIATTIAAAVAGALADDLAAVRAELAELRAAVERPAGDRRLSTRELAAAWGVSERHVGNMARRGMPRLMIGDSPRFDQRAAEAWLSQQTEAVAAE